VHYGGLDASNEKQLDLQPRLFAIYGSGSFEEHVIQSGNVEISS